MGEQEAGALRYTAFLSYSHKDAAAAQRLHRRLETYRLPRRLVGSMAAWGPVPSRLWPIFRDREELPAATDLSETVRQALAQSGSLVVLCSPHAAQSLWVAEEIATFRRLHPDRPVLAAILDGNPPDCFPELLRSISPDGTSHEPLATDLRREGDGGRLGLLKLVAGITGIGLDELVQRDASRRVRRVTAVTAGAVMAMLVMAALTIFALNARAEADRQRAEAEGLIEFMLTDLRERLRGVGRLEIMTSVNRRSLAYYEQRRLAELSPESLERRARILLAMGEDDLNRNNFDSALTAFREAHRTTDEQLRREPNDPRRIFAHSQSEYWVGYVDYRRRNLAAAKAAWQRYKRLTERLLSIDARNPLWLREAAYADGNLCTIAIAPPEDRDAALESCLSALQRMEQVRRLTGLNPALALDLANRHAWAADAWNMQDRWERVQYHRHHQETLARWLIEQDPENLDFQDFWMRTQFTYGRLLIERGLRSRAEPWLRDAAATAEILRSHDGDNESWREMQREIESFLEDAV